MEVGPNALQWRLERVRRSTHTTGRAVRPVLQTRSARDLRAGRCATVLSQTESKANSHRSQDYRAMALATLEGSTRSRSIATE
jgi:hypothetical protein